ncbi:MAG TPA: hypothetical protein VF548_03685 [Allosphingosinicella sp.]|jgi:hypothetical protein
MRLIYWLALGLGTAAIATAAPAGRPASGSFGGPVPKAGGPGGPVGGYHAGPGWRFRVGPGDWRRDDRHGPGRGRGRDRWDRWDRYGGSYGYDGYDGHGLYGGVAVGGRADPYGGGFFAGGGGRIDLEGGRPRYDYDRAYPYEFGSAAAGRGDRSEGQDRPAERPGRCTMENRVRVCRGW